MYRGVLFNRHGRVVSVIEQSVPLPIAIDAAVDVDRICLDESGAVAAKTDLQLDALPWIIGGVITIPLGTQAVFARLPAGTVVLEGPAPVAEFEVTDDFGFSADAPGDYALTFDSPRHHLKTITVRVVEPAPEVEA